jgi:hypothetical protein
MKLRGRLKYICRGFFTAEQPNKGILPMEIAEDSTFDQSISSMASSDYYSPPPRYRCAGLLRMKPRPANIDTPKDCHASLIEDARSTTQFGELERLPPSVCDQIRRSMCHRGVTTGGHGKFFVCTDTESGRDHPIKFLFPYVTIHIAYPF